MVRLSVRSKESKIKVEKGGNFIKDEGIPSALIPIGDSGFYRTPDVVSPGDCYNYPDSPNCGGNPLSKDAIGISIKPSIDSVGRVSVRVSPTLTFFKLPSFTLLYAPPGTRGEAPQDKTPRPPSAPVERLGEGDYGHLRNNKSYLIAMDDDKNETLILRCGRVDVGVAKVKQTYSSGRQEIIDPYPRPTVFVQGVPISGVYRCWIYDRAPASKDADDANWLGEIRTSVPGELPFLLSGRGDLLKRYLSGNCGIYTEEDTDFGNAGNFVFSPPTYAKGRVWISKSKELETCLEPRTRDPIAPPIYPDKCCMECCQPSPNESRSDKALLEKILKKVESLEKSVGKFPVNVTVYDSDENKPEAQAKTLSIKDIATGVKEQFDRVEKTGKIIGIDSLPVTVPDSIIEVQNKGFLGGVLDFFSNDEIKINNLIDLLAWKIKQDSAVMGQWQRKITVEDADATKKGSQEKTVVLPDMGAAFEEMIKLLILNLKSSGLNVDISLKTLIETSSSKALIAEALEIAKDIQNYLDYDTREEIQKVPSQITPPNKDDSATVQNDLHKLLTPSELIVGVKRWMAQDPSHEEKLLTLLEGANAINNVFKGRM